MKSIWRTVAVLAITTAPISVHAAQNVDVKNPAAIAAALNIQTPFAVDIECENSVSQQNCTKSITVPAKQRWVIKTVSGYCNFGTATGNKLALVFLTTNVGSTTPSLFLIPSVPAPFAGTLLSSFNFSGEFYADSGKSVQFNASTSLAQNLDGFSCSVFLSGQAISD